MNSRYYNVAGAIFTVSVPSLDCWSVNPFSLMENYEPFEVSESEISSKASSVFVLELESGSSPEYVEEICQSEECQKIICGHTAESQSVFDFYLQDISVGTLVCSKDYATAKLLIPEKISVSQVKFAINNALMVLYAVATATMNTVLFHAAAVVYQGRAFIFLGQSGTGKSTHARLWLKYNGAELLNDDNPVVRWDENTQSAVVYGSPWSGKTPCYKNEKVTLDGIVLLSQAPYNKIEKLQGVQAYAALVTSISGKRWDESIANGLHRTENALASNVPVWYLECLPDEAAARLCLENVAG